MHIYMSIFPQTTNIDRNYENLNAAGQSMADLEFEHQRRQSTGHTASDLLLNDPLLHQVLRDSELRNDEHHH